MGTRGLRVIRFRKRYYIFYNRLDSYPEGLGTDVAVEIPGDAAKYQEWLAAQRETAAEWEAFYEEFLSVQPGIEKPTESPEFMQHQFPSSLAPLNDTFIEWIYTVDLDRAVPKEAIASLVAEHAPHSSELLGALSDPTVSDSTGPVREMVVPKDIGRIPWRQRHGPILRCIMFYLWSHANENKLAASLLQLSPEDLPFREFAYAALCLVAGGTNINVIPSKNLSTNDAFGYIHEGQEENSGSFMSVLASGAHLQGSSPGSSPKDTIYWLNNVLVFLTAQLYRPGAPEQEIARIFHYCHTNHPGENVDAVSISVEHVILVHITPDRKVQRSAVMPLFNIENHVTMSVSDRYAPSYLKKLGAKEDDFMAKEAKKRRKAKRKTMIKNEGFDIRYGDESDNEDDSNEEGKPILFATKVEGDSFSTFYALVHLFEAAACKRLPFLKTADGLLPNEIYTQIVKHVTDMKTRQALMEVSRTFRRLCQEDLLFAKNLIFEPSDACQSCDEADLLPNWFQMYDIATGTQSQIDLKRAGGFLDYGDGLWQVVIGTEDGKKSLLDQMAFGFVQV